MMTSLTSKPLIQITKSQTVFNSNESDGRIKKEFYEKHCVRLPAFLENDLLREIQEQIGAAQFYNRLDKGIALESCMKKNSVFNFLHFLLNDESLFQWIQKITGCGAIGCFGGRLYRMIPGEGYYDSWHDDLDGKRLIGLSINLSTTVYSGGGFQIKDFRNGKTINKIYNTGFGDAFLFRLADYLKHRVSDVEGLVPRVAFAGWFQSKPRVLSCLKKSIAR